MKHLITLCALALLAIAGCNSDEDVNPDNEALFVDCLVFYDGEFQELPLESEPIYIHGGEDSFGIDLVMEINYPPDARENSIQGTTLTSFEISEAGVLENILDAGSEHETLADATIAGLSTFEGQAIFEPAVFGGEAVRVQKTVMVRYKLQ